MVPPDSPALEISPASYGFPTSCADQVELTLQNVGEAELVIESIDYTASGDLSLVDALLLPLTLAPDEQVPLWVDYNPEAAGPAFGVVDVQSNDPRGVRSAEQAAEAGDSVVEVFEVLADPPSTSCSPSTSRAR